MNAPAIAVAVDGAPASAAALAAAVRQARAEGRLLRGIFVLDTGWADFIGNDWQSAVGARQGFLDYVRSQLEVQAGLARDQFAVATVDVADTTFEVVPGEPLETLSSLVERGEVATLYAGAQVFQVCGRPSVKRLARELRARAGAAVTIV